ncbi:Abortive infection protein [Candidatus Sulfopaludibacter sp. SbA4]|nr:Abortive infection protein [Candidatus Sulfopaludibacter sp. SbA4]
MRPMVKSPAAFADRRRFGAVLILGWMALGAAGIGYARIKDIPGGAAWPVLAAFLTAYPFYLVPAFPALRSYFSGMRLPGWLAASALLPYLVACLGGVRFQWSAVGLLAALALALGVWFIVLPRSPAADIAFLALIPCVLLGGYLNRIYLPVYPRLKDVVFLGHVALIQMAVMALLVERRVPDPGYGFLPNRADWRIGVMHFLYFVPAGLPLALLLNMVHFAKPAQWWLMVPSFFGFLWTVALSEEFFIWGVLQGWLRGWMGQAAAMIGASLTFGLIHISFRGFPNWRWVLLAAVLGWFCGRARNRAGSIRAGMVTHALVFATWRAFFG